MQLPLQDFSALVRTQAAAVGAACRELIDLSVGSVLRAVLEANASVGLWIQWLILEVLATTRAATSTGADLDSWVADFGLARLPAVPAHGVVAFSRITPGLAAVVPQGALVRTGLDLDAQQFRVLGDPGHPNWVGEGYRLAEQTLQIAVPVEAVTAGRAGNVHAGTVSIMSSALPGIDAVTNDAAMAGGLDAEADDTLRVRFGGFIDSRTRATQQAVAFAIQSLQQGLSFVIAERVDTAGAVRAGHFTVTVDDGSGAAPATLLARVAVAIEAIRPVGASFSVRAPLVVPAEVAMQVIGPARVVPVVRAAVSGYMQSLPIGEGLAVSRLFQVVHEASVEVASVHGVTINGVAGDLVPPPHGLIRPVFVDITQ